MKQEDFEKGRLQPKYQTKNFLYKNLVNSFNSVISDFYQFYLETEDSDSTKKIIEVGVGEGQILEICLKHFPNAFFHAVDIAPGILEIAKKNLKQYNANIVFELQDIHSLPYESDTYDLITCCEVLEHVKNPKKAISELHRILKSNGYALLSVPNEPIWRIANMLRGHYWRSFGNTPGHINHWSMTQFQELVRNGGFKIVNSKKSFPWSLLLIQK